MSKYKIIWTVISNNTYLSLSLRNAPTVIVMGKLLDSVSSVDGDPEGSANLEWLALVCDIIVSAAPALQQAPLCI